MKYVLDETIDVGWDPLGLLYAFWRTSLHLVLDDDVIVAMGPPMDFRGVEAQFQVSLRDLVTKPGDSNGGV